MRLLAKTGKGMTSQQIESALSLPRTTVISFIYAHSLCPTNVRETKKKKYYCGAIYEFGLQVIKWPLRLHQNSHSTCSALSLKNRANCSFSLFSSWQCAYVEGGLIVPIL